MSFGGLFDGDSGGRRLVADLVSYGSTATPAGVRTQPLLLSNPTVSKHMLGSTGLSLGLQSNLRGKGELSRLGAASAAGVNSELDALCRNKDDENESRSGSDNLEGGSGDDLEQENPRKKKRYHRHTPQQIQELEGLFKECPHPDEKQRSELSRRLGLENRQVKFWFQNRRTQMKTQLERHENTILRQENDKLRSENISIRDAMRSAICSNCGGAAILGELSLEEQHLRIENSRLRDELDRVCILAGKFLGRPISTLMPSSSLELVVGGNSGGFVGFGSGAPAFSSITDLVGGGGGGVSNSMGTVITPPSRTAAAADGSFERSLFLELALSAMDELVKMAEMGEPLWISGSESAGKEVLNFEQYEEIFPRCVVGAKASDLVAEATRETTMVIINSLALVETLMDAARWADMFPGMIARTTTTDVISAGVGGTRNGALQLMHAELQVLSPLVPTREVNFLRFCKQLADGAWAVVDVSIDGIRDNTSSSSPSSGLSSKSRRLPSGCVVQDMPNGYSKVTWVEHGEYNEEAVHQLYRPLLRSGMALGAQRWVATLQRQCECLAILMSTSVSNRDHQAITATGRRSMLKLAQRMTDNFCSGVCASSARKWSRLANMGGRIGEDVRVMTRQSMDDPGEPPGVVLSAATSVWLPVSPHRLFNFLRDETLRSRWDILSNGGPMQEMAHIAKGHDQGNAVSLLRAGAVTANQSSMLILQETCTDPSGSMVVYAPVDVPAMHLVMNGGDSAYVALLPSGFAVMPDGTTAGKMGSGSLLTVAFQILVNSLPTAKLTVESVETVNNLISCTVQKIKAALQCET
ncbi:Homeobox-leucine zipper protein HDG1 [Platanthera zijinensis]|uniref:Homeobox-leucine zipper protein HDG1 n=1 Tax=Platanthera zijinensis TaxID=2320716 RepID=A0AAP0GFZ9_9ASPA